MRKIGAAALAVGMVVTVLSAIALVTGSPASAKGKHGPVAWPSAVTSCSYAGRTLTQVKVNPPRVSMDKKLARRGGKAQYVGVRVMLQGLKAGRWVKVAKRPKKRAYAATVKVHPRKMTSVKHAKLLTFKSSTLPSAYSSFRATVTLQWYAYNGHTIRGQVARTSAACVRTKPAPPPHVTKIDAGYSFACAQMSDKTMRCWGSNTNGRLGIGSSATYVARPVRVPGMSDVSSISVGYDSACGVSGVDGSGFSGVARCWGSNAHGQLGDGTKTSRSRPTAVKGLANVVWTIDDRTTTCAGSRGNPLKCWGLDSAGQAGDKGTADVLAPKNVTGQTYIASATTGNQQGCAVNNVSVVACWGRNDSYGQLGISGSDTTVRGPTAISVPGASLLASGGQNVCAVVTDGAVRCWGADNQGQLGNGGSTNSPKPVAAGTLTGVTAISAMNNSVCAVTRGAVYCWGGNANGQLGVGDLNARNKPTRVPRVSGAVGVVVGNTTTYAWDAAGHVWAWGDNSSGAFGDGSTTNSLTPVAVSIH